MVENPAHGIILRPMTTGKAHSRGKAAPNAPTWRARLSDYGQADLYAAEGLKTDEPCTDAEWNAFVDRMRRAYGEGCLLMKAGEWEDAT